MPKPAHQLVLIRHGESTWNLENRFTGWTDVPLTDTGVAQARKAGQLDKAAELNGQATQAPSRCEEKHEYEACASRPQPGVSRTPGTVPGTP